MRSLRILLTILALLGLLLLGLVASLWAWVTPERVRLQVVDAVRSNLGLTIVMENPTALHRLPSLTFTIPEGMLCPPGETGGDACARFERIDVRMNPFAVFAPSPRLNDVTITGLRMTLSRAGTSERFFQTLGSGGWNIDRMTWQSAAVTVADEASGTTLTLQGLDVTFGELSEAGGAAAWRTQLAADALSGEVTGSAHLDWSTPARGLVLAGLAAEGRGLIESREWSGRLNAEEVLWTGRTANARNLTTELRAAGTESLRITLPKASWADSKVEAPQAQAALTADTADGRWEANLTADLLRQDVWAMENLTLGTRFAGNGVAAAPAMSELRGRIRMPGTLPGEVALEGLFFGSPATVSARILPAEETDASDGRTRPLVLAEVTTGVLRAGPLSALLWRPDVLTRFDLRGRITMEGVAELPAVRALRADAELTGGELNFPGAKAEILGGTADIAAHVDAAGAWRAALRLRNARADAAFRGDALVPLSGKLSADATLTGDLTAEKRLAQIDGTFRIEEGAFAGMDLAALRATLLADQPDRAPSHSLQPESSTAFTELTAAFAQTGEDPLLISNGKLTGRGWSADVTGERSGEAANARWSVRLAIAVHPEDEEPGFPLPALAIWKAGAPQWSLDWPSALAAVHEAKGEPPLTVEGVIRSAKRAAEDFWNSLGSKEWKLPELPEFKLPELPDWKLPDWVPFGQDGKDEPAEAGKPNPV